MNSISHGGRAMTDKQTKRYSSETLKELQQQHPLNWQKIDAINYQHTASDDDFNWDNAKLVTPKAKKQISLRVDSDLLQWFKNEAETRNMRGYQSFIHTVLQSYRNAQNKQG